MPVLAAAAAAAVAVAVAVAVADGAGAYPGPDECFGALYPLIVLMHLSTWYAW